MIPLARMEAASSSRRSELNTDRGCIGFGCMASIGSLVGRCGASPAAVPDALAPGLAGRSADKPLPSALRGLSFALFIFQNLLGQLDVTLRPPGARIIDDDRFAVAWRFRQPDTPRNHGRQDLVAEEVLQIVS